MGHTSERLEAGAEWKNGETQTVLMGLTVLTEPNQCSRKIRAKVAKVCTIRRYDRDELAMEFAN